MIMIGYAAKAILGSLLVNPENCSKREVFITGGEMQIFSNNS
jgi:hypothetical protein